METEHIVSEPVRAYLLGQLEGAEAVALEEKYFMDRSFFLRVQAIEQRLIEEYLENRLPRSERRQFESRYLKIPALRQRLEEVRAEWAVSRPAPKSASWWAWRAAFAACVIGAVGIAWIYVHQHRHRSAEVTQIENAQEPASHQQSDGAPVTASGDNSAKPPVVGKAQHSRDKKILTFRLRPKRSEALVDSGSANKGIDGIALQLPPAGGSIRLVVDLTDEMEKVFCAPEIWFHGPDGSVNKVWSLGKTAASVPVNGGQELTITVDSSLFHAPGYYELKLVRAGGETGEFLMLHVTGPR